MAAEVAEFCAKLDKNYISEYVHRSKFLYGIFTCVGVKHLLACTHFQCFKNSHHELVRLLKRGEGIDTLLAWSPETLLLRWVNHHLARVCLTFRHEV